MDYIFWLGLLIGAVLSLAASIVANLSNIRIDSYIKNRKITLSLKRKNEDVKEFEFVKKLERDFRAFFSTVMFNMVMGIFWMLIGLNLIILLLIFVLNERVKTPAMPLLYKDFFTQSLVWFGVFVSLSSLYLSFLRFSAAIKYMDKVNNFEDYRRVIIENYPDYAEN